MKIKRFQAADVRQAIREVREVLGPDAVILSNTRVDGGVEIVAATDYDASQFRQPEPASHRQQKTPSVEIDPQTPQPSGPARQENIWSQEPTLVQMRKEIASLRDMLQNQLSDLAWKDMARQSPTQIQLLKRHLQMGTEVELAKTLTQQAAHIDDLETAWRQSLGQLAGQIPLWQTNFLDEGGITALLGPTGVGKTTTIAKLAARCALKHGARQVALITTDCYRIGGQEQLRTYARILGVPVRVARNHDELATTLSELVDRRFILIDTAGMNSRDIQLTQKFELLRQRAAHIRPLLTLSATTQNSALNDMISAFSHLNLDGCIVTKTDETSGLGGIISALVRHQLPLAFVCNGQQVPEDLSLARPNTLVNQASELMQSSQHTPDPQTVSSYGGFAAYG
ncbi:Flagellar biosynthesis protein FlhF [Methylophaga frappieri]|uniref:Flagellar biosynthesis protein FlhF n=1 Tax=Methylophaga frappieri (strain ATCC BAA-2434 / DSM 25690 / JAM7) TaxID=754477 RepID=I1YHL9_METFJ|nr:flagellar biosynthesis protein FlhF [Methylophaga frappieri]AFJ02412.1 Flagellar biosynthesis protein FlhF [Methylophaga frappieri]